MYIFLSGCQAMFINISFPIVKVDCYQLSCQVIILHQDSNLTKIIELLFAINKTSTLICQVTLHDMTSPTKLVTLRLSYPME